MDAMQKRKIIKYFIEEIDGKIKTNKRKIHRNITAISAITLLIKNVSGTIYSIFFTIMIRCFLVNKMAYW